MTEKLTGGQAFPRGRCNEERQEAILKTQGADDAWGTKGMTLREHYAGLAMQGWIASRPVVMGEVLGRSPEMAEVIARAAFVMADAMLEARK